MNTGALWAAIAAAGTLVFEMMPTVVAAAASNQHESRSALLEVAAHSQRFRGQLKHSSSGGVLVPPTAPPELNPWEDVQPIDTQIGNYFTSSMSEDAINMPPPNLTANYLALGCPLLLSWPSSVDVAAPDPCEGSLWDRSKGSWRATGDAEAANVVQYFSSCDFLTRNFAEELIYKLPGGDLFGTSQTATTLSGTKIELRDCVGNIRYTIEEKVYKQESTVNSDACANYQSCDGTIYLQYFVRDQALRVIAETPYLNLFQGHFQVVGANGSPIAVVSRVGTWTPVSTECGPRTWTVAFAEYPEAPFADVLQRWPIVEMVSIMTHRDQLRRPSGLTRPSACEVTKVVIYFFLFLLTIFLLCFGSVIFREVIRTRLQIIILRLELWLCPKRMNKGSKMESR